MERSPEPLGAQVAQQHAQHERAFGIHVVRAERRERHATPLVDLQILVVLVEVVVVLGVGAELHPPVLPREKLGEALVEPHVGPVLEGHVVAEPLVRQLVRDQDPLVPRTVEVGALVGEPVDERRGAHVLHPAEEVRHRGLGVLGPGVPNAGELGVHLDHVRGHAEQAPGAIRIGAVHVVLHRHAAPRVGELDERCDDEGHEIGRAARVLAPGDGMGAVGIPPVGHQPPVRDHAVLPRHGGGELPGHLVVREVVGREPEVVVVVLALAPDLLRPVLPALGLDERQPAAVVDARVVVDRKAQRVVEGERARGVHYERVAMGGTPEARAAGVDDARHNEPLARIEDHGVQPGAERHQRGRHAAVERRRVPIEVPDLDTLMHQVVIVGPGVGVVHHALRVRLRGDGSGQGEQGGIGEGEAHALI